MAWVSWENGLVLIAFLGSSLSFYGPLPVGKCKDRLARLLARVPAGIALNEHTDAGGGRDMRCSHGSN
jgi:hypothetical protein